MYTITLFLVQEKNSSWNYCINDYYYNDHDDDNVVVAGDHGDDDDNDVDNNVPDDVVCGSNIIFVFVLTKKLH